jgi:hypothetical protein
MSFFSCNENDGKNKIPKIRRILNESLGCEVLGWFVNHIATLENAPSYFGGQPCQKKETINSTSLCQSIYLTVRHGHNSTITQESFTSASREKTYSTLGTVRIQKEKVNGGQKFLCRMLRWKSMSTITNSADQLRPFPILGLLSRSKREDYTGKGTGICYQQDGRNNRDGILYKGCNIDTVKINKNGLGRCEFNTVGDNSNIDSVKLTQWTVQKLHLRNYRR